MSRPNFNCKYYRPWLGTSRGEINDACVDDEKRVSARCDYNPKTGECWKTEKGGKA